MSMSHSFSLDKEKQDEVVASITVAQGQRIPLHDMEDTKTKQDIIVDTASMAPGGLAGFKASMAIPVPNPYAKLGLGLVGAVIGGEATKELVEPVVRPVVELLTPPPSQSTYINTTG